tara:strand:+ start:42 stop:266 length:225 start_codon:yes stop_codon:yes gene_type:complete
MISKNIPADIRSKSIKETREEINKILNKIEKDDANLESHTSDYDRLLKLNKHIDELFKKKLKEINSRGKKNVKK